MKNLLAVMLLVVLLFAFAGCNNSKDENETIETKVANTEAVTEAETQVQTEKETEPPTEDNTVIKEKKDNNDTDVNVKKDEADDVVEKEKTEEFPAIYYSAVDYAAVLAIDENGATFFNGVIDTIPKGTSVQVFGKETAKNISFDGTETYEEYYRVNYNGNEGYVRISELTR